MKSIARLRGRRRVAVVVLFALGAVGPNNYIEGVNSAYGIYSKAGSLLASFTENSLWSGNGSFCDGHGGGDPVVIYDPMADRWILTHLAYGPGASTGPFYQCVAVSRSGNPVSGGWYLYALQMDQGLVPPNTLNDYPKFGIWTDCLDFSFNGFLMPAGAYNGTGYGSLSRSDMYAGASLTWALGFLPGQASDAFTMIPSNLEAPGSAGLPPAGTPDYFVSESIFNFAWNVRKFTAGANCGGGGTLGAATPVGQSSYSGGGGSIVPQPPPATAANTLDSLFDRMMQKVQYRRVGSAESLWVVHTVGNSGANTGPQWGQIDVSGGTVSTTPVQQQIYMPDASLYRWMPSIAADKAGNVAMGYSTATATSVPATLRRPERDPQDARAGEDADRPGPLPGRTGDAEVLDAKAQEPRPQAEPEGRPAASERQPGQPDGWKGAEEALGRIY